MFVAAVLALCCGIYVEALHGGAAAPLFLACAALMAAAPLFSRSRIIFTVLLLAAFALCGAGRLALVGAGTRLPTEAGGRNLYQGTVVESAPRLKVLSLTRPESLSGMRVALFSALDLPLGHEVRLFGEMRPIVPSFRNPGTVSWKWLKRLEGVSFQLRGEVLSTTPGSDPVAALRRYFEGNIERSGAGHAAILKALTIGDRAAVTQEEKDLFLHTGTSHILAISGFNVGIISGFFFFIARAAFRRIRRFRLSGRDRRYAALVTMPFPFLFMLVAGAGVSVIRAAIMVAVFMFALFLERERDFYNTAALAALVILLVYPHSLLTPSFQLTFLSLLFMVMAMDRLLPLIMRLKSRAARWSISTVSSTAAATVGTAPVVLYYFYGMNPLCLVHNLVTIPLMGVAATVLGLLGMATPYGRPLLLVAGKVAGLNLALLHGLDFGYLYPLVRPTLTEALLYYSVLATLLLTRRKRAAALVLSVLLPLCAIQAYADYRQRFNDDLGILFIDVGQGNAALIEAPGGLRILVDGGGYAGTDFDMGKQVLTPLLLYRKIRTVDYVVNTHPHADHIGGLAWVLRNFNVSHLVTAGIYPNVKESADLLAAAAERRIPRLVWRKGDAMADGPFRMDVLHPESISWEDPNNSALVLKVGYGESRFLLPADIGSGVEEGLVMSGAPLRSDVIEVPHHGSAGSSSPAFIAAVRPALAVVSCAEGHVRDLPSPLALARYRALSIPVLRTDRHGLVEVRSDGRKITWRTYGGP